METPDRPADDRHLPRPTRRAWLWLGARAAFVGLLAAAAGEFGSVFFAGNFHTTLPGQFYRCSQPSPARLKRLIRDHGIRTVVNLRGPCSSFDWYLNECRQSAEMDVCQEDLCFSAGRLPAVPEIRRLVEVLDRSERPLLFHCQRGADRTGLTAAIVLLLQTDAGLAEARWQLGLRYGHLALGRPANLDWFLDLYADWLRRQGLEHSPAAFRRWVEEDYCPGPCRCTLEWLDPPAPLPRGRPVARRIRAHNTSPETWHLSPDGGAGIHLTFTLNDEHCRYHSVGRAGLFRADVPPGGSIDLTLALPAFNRPGRYHLLVDMVDEQQCCFYQTGSEPLEEELDVREQETAPGLQPGPAGPAGLADQLAPGR
jgi:hypothetical protein